MLNQMTVIGNVGKTPELRKTKTGQEIVHFSVAVTETRTIDGERLKHTEWFAVTFWGRNAETAAKFLKAGNSVWVQGRLSASQYTDGMGELRYSLNIAGSQLGLLPNSNKATSEAQETSSYAPMEDVDPINKDPF